MGWFAVKGVLGAGRVSPCPRAPAIGWPESTGPRSQDIRHRNQTMWLIQTQSWDWDFASTASCWPEQVTRPAQMREVGKQISLSMGKAAVSLQMVWEWAGGL